MQPLEFQSKVGAAAMRRGAKRNPVEVLVRLWEDDYGASKEALFARWRTAVEADSNLLEAVLLSAFTNIVSAIERNNKRPVVRPRQEVKAARSAAAAVLSAAVREVVLMDLEMPNGKKLRECTFSEVGQFGSWFKLLACKGKPSEIVGKVLTEDDLRKIGR